MKNTGYIKIHRSLFQSPEWAEERFSKVQAWIDLLGMAAYEDTHVYLRNIKVTVPRGSMTVSLRTLAERWKWDVGTVRRYFLRLQNEGQIHTQKTNLTTLLSIVNYDKYQSNAHTEADADTDNDAHTDAHAISNEINKYNFVDDNKHACACVDGWKEVQMNSAWLESIQYCIHQRFQIIPTAEQIQQELEGFKAYQIASDTKYENIDVKRHFLNWLLNRIEQKQNETNRNISRDEQRKQEQDKRLQGYAAVAEAMLNGDYQVQDPTQVD